jgi:hypothetical protein
VGHSRLTKRDIFVSAGPFRGVACDANTTGNLFEIYPTILETIEVVGDEERQNSWLVWPKGQQEQAIQWSRVISTHRVSVKALNPATPSNQCNTIQ